MKLLVCAITQTRPQGYLPGDIVAWYDDAYVFSPNEGLPTFWQITVLSLLTSDRTQLFEAVPDQFVPSFITRRRKRFIDTTQLSAQAQTSLAANGTATIARLGLLNALTLRA